MAQKFAVYWGWVASIKYSVQSACFNIRAYSNSLKPKDRKPILPLTHVVNNTSTVTTPNNRPNHLNFGSLFHLDPSPFAFLASQFVCLT